jgi:hypothetical protein
VARDYFRGGLTSLAQVLQANGNLSLSRKFYNAFGSEILWDCLARSAEK